MNGARLFGAVLLVGGILALAFGGFSYTKDSTEANLGPISVEIKDKESVNVPMWAGVAAAVVGAGLLVAGGKKS